MKKLGLLFIALFSMNAFALEIPQELKDLLQGKDEAIYKGETKSGFGCEFRVSQNKYGFFIEGYERDMNGEIDYIREYARFVLDDTRELYEFYASPFYGIEAESRLFSSAGVSFDLKTLFKADMTNGEIRDLHITHYKNNGFYFYKMYKLKCIIKYSK